MDKETIISEIKSGNTALGIEFGSTRIKAILITTCDNAPVASGNYDWENKYENNIWTYGISDIWKGLQECYESLCSDISIKYDVALETIGSIGFSGMMHGYMPFDKEDNLLTPFRTWRNTITSEASEKLSESFQFNIPQRWSIAHLYQAILNNEEHVGRIDYITTLAGYIHWQLTGCKVLGIGEASGMFPVDSNMHNYDMRMVSKFNTMIECKNYGWGLIDILPKILVCGQNAGVLTPEGAKLLDKSGILKPGIPLCPPEGDAGTGMTATNSVSKRTGNVSAGTSVFAMAVLEKPLSKLHKEIDIVTTPAGDSVAMVHCNNCTSDINAWIGLFREFASAFNIELDNNKLYGTLFNKALEADKSCGGLLSYNYFSGEHVTAFQEGRPIFVRNSTDDFNLANFMRTHLYSALATLKIGMDILLKDEKIKLDKIYGHGGFFKTPEVGQKIMAAALNTPVSVMSTASEGGAWGIAVLASFMSTHADGESFSDFLSARVFGSDEGITINPDVEDVAGFDEFINRFKAGFSIEKAAVASLE